MDNASTGDIMRGGAGPLLLKHTSRTNEMFSAAPSSNKPKAVNMSRIDTFTRRLSILDNTGSIAKTLDALKEDEERRKNARKSFWSHGRSGSFNAGSNRSARRSSGGMSSSSGRDLVDGGRVGLPTLARRCGGREQSTQSNVRDSIVRDGSRKEFLFRTFVTKLQDLGFVLPTLGNTSSSAHPAGGGLLTATLRLLPSSLPPAHTTTSG